MAEKKKIPEIRFKGFDGEWFERRIGDILTEKRQNIELQDNELYELITVKRRNEGIVSRGYLKGKNILVKNYFQISVGDFVISKRQVVHGANGIVPNELDNAIVSNEYLIAVSNTSISSEFWALLSKQPEMYKKFFLSSYGVDIEKLFFDAEDWKKRFVIIPKLTEQSQIGTYFQILDKLITQHQQKYDKLVILKKAMLEKMFPKNGADVPEIRFKGFEGKWEKRKLGEIGNTYTGLSGKTKDDFGHGEGKYVTYMNIFSNPVSNRNITEPIEIDNYQNEVQFGDVFFTTSSETPEEVGMSSVWLENLKNVYLNSFCFGYRPALKMDSYFLAYMLRSFTFRKKITFLAQGISRYNISKTKVMEIAIPIPNIDEQIKVGIYFQNLDNLISLHQKELEKLKNIKKACLEKMFV